MREISKIEKMYKDILEIAVEDRDKVREENERLYNKIKNISEQMNEQINFKTENANEIIRLKKAFEELEKYIEDNSFYEIVFHTRIIDANKLLNKLQELKGSDKE